MLFYIYIAAALVFDLIAGDPRWFPHPVRFIGWLCVVFEAQMRKFADTVSLRWCGFFSFLCVIAASMAMTSVILVVLWSISRTTAVCFAVMLLYLCIAAGDLMRHSRAVYKALAVQTIAKGQK